MRYFRRLIRPFSVFFVINILLTLFAPTETFALTSGPNMPEYTSFEPVDTTDMVSLATGDFTYNIPLIEVPGPEGGYPLSLSYHAGISPNDEASWVGLGWTLNPGAINRVVNGYPDDQYDNIRTVHDFWPGGERNTYSVGLGYGGASIGLSVARDTYQGIGLGASLGFGIPIKLKGGKGVVKAGVEMGVDPFGGAYGSASIGFKGASIGYDTRNGSARIGFAAKTGTSVGLSTNFRSVDAFISQSVGPVHGTLGTKGVKSSIGLSGFSAYQANSNFGKISTQSFGLSASLIVVPITLGFDYLRYWSDERDQVKVIGALHADKATGKSHDDYGFDSFVVPAPLDGVVKENDPEMSPLSGSFPSPDFYNVSAQGLSGNIQPYIFDNGTTFRQNVKDSEGNYIIKFNNGAPFTRPQFRFLNDFSNARVAEDQSIRLYGPASIYNGTVTGTPSDGFGNGQLAGSKHVAYFTIKEINDGTAKAKGFIDYSTEQRSIHWNLDYTADISDQVGGFSITNESGVTYHYALPVYTHSEYSKTSQTQNPATYHEQENKTAYAYTWLLTAVTGADYIDSSSTGVANGVIDSNDWGYYVKFDYGKWADQYMWRNPHTGTRKDIDQSNEFWSYGAKELYYLNSISTRTHTALFIKEIRNDAKGVVRKEGGSDAYTAHAGYMENCISPGFGCTFSSYDFTDYPVSSLKLNSVYLLKNEDVPADLAAVSNDQYHSVLVNTTLPPMVPGGPGQPLYIRKHYDTNVIDVTDIVNSDLRSKSVKVIDLVTNYSLCPQTVNSYTFAQPGAKTGKLTLEQVVFAGKGGVSVLPPTKFYYDKNPSFDAEAYDIWGYYKSDYDPSEREGMKRMVSLVSEGETDAWSLSRVKTPMGNTIAINYESDVYSNALTYRGGLYIDQITALTAGDFKVTFFNNLLRGDIEKLKPNDDVDILGLALYWGSLVVGGSSCVSDNHVQGDAPSWKLINKSVKVKEVHSDYLVLNDQSVFDDLTVLKGIQCVECQGSGVFLTGQTTGCGGTYRFNELPEFLGGNLFFHTDTENYGGGIRVSNIEVRNFNGTSRTNYTYEDGVTSYEPVGLEDPILRTGIWSGASSWAKDRQDQAVKKYTAELQKRFSSLLALSRVLPAPGVIYGTVRMSEQMIDAYGTVSDLPGYKRYRFETFRERHVVKDGPSTTDNTGNHCLNGDGEEIPCVPDHQVNPLVLDDFTSTVGTLRDYEVYGPDNVILERTTYDYLHSGRTPDQYKQELETQVANQGVISQVFNEDREVNDNGVKRYRTLSQINQYPIVPLGETSTNYKTGITTNIKNLAFDFYSGTPTSVQHTDGYGNQFVTVTKPAYTVGNNSGMTSQQITDGFVGMGLKVKNPKNRHMLIQNAITYTYKQNGSSPGLVAASAEVWDNDLPIMAQVPRGQWQIRYNYSWAGRNAPLLPDGLYPFLSYSDLNFNNLDANPEWERVGELTLYDKYSHSLEAKDMSGIYAAVKFSSDQKYVVATASNSKYDEFAYAGAEDPLNYLNDFSGNIKKESGQVVTRPPLDPDNNLPDNTSVVHTGLAAVKLTATNNRTFVYTFTSTGKTYRASVWTNSEDARLRYKVGNGSVQEVVPTSTRKAGNWYLVEATIPAPLDETVVVWCSHISGVATFDDFRVHTIDGAMQSYVYNEWGELSHTLDTNNLYTEYRYDRSGKLRATFRETFNYSTLKVNEQQYHYANN